MTIAQDPAGRAEAVAESELMAVATVIENLRETLPF
jgi:hypothetical protein